MDIPFTADPDDVLAQSTRARLFALLGDLRRAAGTLELADRLGLRPNGVRAHLERLEEAGLVQRTRAPQRRGRPRHAWMIAPTARPGGEAPRAYGDLGRWLARALPSRTGGQPDVEEVGRAIGREIELDDTHVDADPMTATLSAFGFQPKLDESDSHDARTYCLGNCPYRDAVRQNPDVVCALHRGMTRGLLDVLEPGAELTEFIARDPDIAGCRITVAASRRNEPRSSARGNGGRRGRVTAGPRRRASDGASRNSVSGASSHGDTAVRSSRNGKATAG